MDELNCYFCGHQMDLLTFDMLVADNGRAYITESYKCLFEHCPSQKQYGCGCTVHKTIYGVTSKSKFKIDKQKKKHSK